MRFTQLVLDCNDLDAQEAFWTQVLRYRRTGGVGQYVVLRPADGADGPKLLLQRVPETKSAKNRLHLDVTAADAEAEATRLVGLGATRQGRVEEFGIAWIVMHDPEGNEFCIEQDPDVVASTPTNG